MCLGVGEGEARAMKGLVGEGGRGKMEKAKKEKGEAERRHCEV